MRILIRDNYNENVREYGTNQHDALLISKNGGCLTYEHLQCGDGSMENGQGGFSFVLEDGKTPEESDSAEAMNCCCYANIGGFDVEPEPIHEEQIKTISEFYGYDAQSRQCIEEMAELTQAINKLWRSRGVGQSTDKCESRCMDNLIEELADVQITLWQLQYLLKADISQIIEQKLDRQIERIKSEEQDV